MLIHSYGMTSSFAPKCGLSVHLTNQEQEHVARDIAGQSTSFKQHLAHIAIT